MKQLQNLILSAFVCLSSVGAASAAHAQQPAPLSQDAMSEGEIKKVDKEAGKLTIKHGELKNLGMPGMTMAFKVKDASMLDKVKPGDKVRFVADKIGGAYTVLSIDTPK